jgi:ubiquinone/menaquinone biosynthesis C-methylase UbiE
LNHLLLLDDLVPFMVVDITFWRNIMRHPVRDIFRSLSAALAVIVVFVAAPAASAQEKSVRPGINTPFQNPDVKEFLGKFEVESREIFARRNEIVAACKLKPGMVIADVGAGTGLFTRLFAREVSPGGKVFAVDIAPKFVEHIKKTCKEQGLENVVAVVCKPDSVELPANSIDLAFICDTYHHFEFPFKTMTSVYRALRPGGQVVLIDFHRIEGKSSAWVLNHVRAGQETVTREIASSGFKQVAEANLLKENYFVRFVKN